MAHEYLFVLCPPFSGSTVLWKLLGTSPAVSSLPYEGQALEGVREFMRTEPWNPGKRLPWLQIKATWEKHWDLHKPILLEKSPPNIARAFEIEKVFQPAAFVAMIRNPYAFCESHRRRLDHDVQISAGKWIAHAAYQIKNITGLKKLTHFTYERFTEQTPQIKKQILNFMPALQDIDITQSFAAHASDETIQNFNHEKIGRLRRTDIDRINAVLQEHEDVLKFFGYELI
ncbi:MAG: hypothetical protein ALAOOOJD_01391 [bacterium]|nr:hypothetical protein [bacterium]